ncbi:HGxxPAAW family protein [Paeniglutamicibacter sp. R2-26]|uniref:HGxxPAAW family protein n=1 Tax=Paeniglutamicibacter sp. R2-26 TaxID=3144417 RepID=UPI003EE5FC81
MANSNTQIDPMHSEEIGHGNSIAAWTLVGISMIGVIVAGVSFAGHNSTMVYAGLGIVVVGLIAGWVMKKAGFGVGGARSGSSH